MLHFFHKEFNFRRKKDLVENFGPTLFAISFSFICSSNPQCLIYVRLELTVYLFRDLKLHWCDEVKLQADAVSRVLTSTWWWGRSHLEESKPIQRFLEKVVRTFYKCFSRRKISLSTEVKRCSTCQRLLKKIKTACLMLLLVNSLGLNSDAEWSTFLDLSNFWIMHGTRNKTNSDEQEACNS